MLMTAVNPSSVSLPLKLASFSRSRPLFRACRLMTLVRAVRMPVMWEPPSGVAMVLAKASSVTLGVSVY